MVGKNNRKQKEGRLEKEEEVLGGRARGGILGKKCKAGRRGEGSGRSQDGGMNVVGGKGGG